MEKSKNDLAIRCEKCYYDEKYYVNGMKFKRGRSIDKAGSLNDICAGM